jgi:hypothetical protein
MGSNDERLLVVDDVPMSMEYMDDINPNDVAQIDIIRKYNVAATSAFGIKGKDGVIIIFTKKGGENTGEIPPSHTKTILPLGYQQPVEFYAPKYDTPEKRNVQTPDLRTTVHWQPIVQTNSAGEASFEFYTADEQTPYTVVIEGLANNGSIIRKEGKMWRKETNNDW